MLSKSLDLCFERSILVLMGGFRFPCRTGECLATFINHAERVISFVLAPQDTTLKYKNALISVGEDNSVAVIDLDDMNWFVFCEIVCFC